MWVSTVFTGVEGGKASVASVLYSVRAKAFRGLFKTYSMMQTAPWARNDGGNNRVRKHAR
jgi:hypothetical protein